MSNMQRDHASLRVLVVGLGSIGRRHARLLGQRQDVDVILCDRSHARLDETRALLDDQCAFHTTDYADALAQRPDIVVVCTPNESHVPLATAAIDAGADVLVEKPISNQMSMARQLVDHAQAAGRLVRVGYMLRFDSGLMTIKKLVEQGAVGQLTAGRALIGSYITLLNAVDTDRVTRQNTLILDYSHELDFLRWIFGSMDRVVCAVGVQSGALPIRPQPNVVQMILQMQGNVFVQVHMDYIQYPQRRSLEVIGDQGTISYDFMTGEIRVYTFGAQHVWQSADVTPLTARVDDLFRAQFEDYLDCRRTGRVASNMGADTLESLRMSEEVIRMLNA